MKCLTVRQPWASLIVAGVKDVENRTWRTSYRGPLAIHGAKTAATLRDYGHLFDGEPPCGVVLGTVELVDCVQDSDSEWADHGPRTWNWIVRMPVAFSRPVRARGQQRLWEWSRQAQPSRVS